MFLCFVRCVCVCSESNRNRLVYLNWINASGKQRRFQCVAIAFASIVFLFVSPSLLHTVQHTSNEMYQFGKAKEEKYATLNVWIKSGELKRSTKNTLKLHDLIRIMHFIPKYRAQYALARYADPLGFFCIFLASMHARHARHGNMEQWITD